MRKVVMLAFDGVSLLDLSGPLEAMRVASTHERFSRGRPAYQLSVVSVRGGAIMTSDGVAIVTEKAAHHSGPIDSLIVPGALDVADVTRDQKAIDWVSSAARRSRRVCSVCAGSFLLAAAGLLRGRRAATHWMHCDRLQSSFPTSHVEPDAIYVRDGKIWTSAGVTTGIDLALALIEEDYGRAVSMHVARVLVVYLRRPGGQSQYSTLLEGQAQVSDQRFEALERWMGENLTSDLRVERLAAKAGMSPRNFSRRYTRERQKTPARAVEAMRVDAARRELEDSAASMHAIALRCGFADDDHLRAAFARQLGITPSAYRQRFAG